MHPVKLWSKTTEPSSYEQIYTYLEQALNDCSTFITDLEVDYFQAATKTVNTSNRSLPVVALTSWSEPLNELRDARLLRDIRNGKTIRELLGEARIGTLLGPFSDESVVLMKRMLDKTSEQLYSQMPILIGRINDSMDLMERYFLSFYEINEIEDIIQKKSKEVPPDPYLETAYSYEKSRWLHMFQVKKCLKVLSEMGQRVEDNKGVMLSTLSKECQELAQRCDCSSLSYAFALPECYHEARRALVELHAWLGEDKDYNDFVQTALKVIEEKYLTTKKQAEWSQAQLSQIEHRAETFRLQLSKLEEEHKINEVKQEEFETRRNLKEREYVSKRLTYEVHVEQVEKLRQPTPSSDDPPIDNRLLIERFLKDIRDLARDVKKFKSQMDAIQTRLRYFEERKQELIKMRQESQRITREAQVALEEKILKENQFHRLKRCREILRQIYKCRTINDLPQKIFYNLPVKNKHPAEKDQEDELSRACHLISKTIGRDWNRLYWQLPFHPTRGQEELAKDIKSIDQKYQRGDVCQQQAMAAFHKWRRFHTRAKLDDLLQAVQKIRRLDLIQSLERNVLKPKHLLNVDSVEIDPRKKEIEDLNRKLTRLFDKMRTGAISSHDTYVYSTIGLDPLRPSVKSARTSMADREDPVRSSSINLRASRQD